MADYSQVNKRIRNIYLTMPDITVLDTCSNMMSDQFCDAWWLVGGCNNDPDYRSYMLENCRKTCTRCDFSYTPSEGKATNMYGSPFNYVA